MPVTQHSKAVARDLDVTFSVVRMHRAWNEQVRNGLRSQPLKDLHDFLDVHRNIRTFLEALRAEVLAGSYRPQPPEVTLLEKRDGIPRRLLLPLAGDAILLQTLVSALERAIDNAQPHANAYYSRSHARPSPDQLDDTFAYPWWVLWPRFQKRIWGFARSRKYVVITDLANYFDCVPLSGLRNRIASFEAFRESVLNFLFFLLDAFIWRPYYMPQSGVGLPQINFDAPRLLAHAYLFPLDHELERRTGGDFVRWMDDINCGVDSVDEARRLLRALEIVANSLGVRLNGAKTKILTSREALDYFWVRENAALTALTNLARSVKPATPHQERLCRRARSRYRRFRRGDRVGHWDKVWKRYFNLFGLLGDTYLQREVPSVLSDHPGLRAAACRYYARLGPSKTRLQHLSDFLSSGKCLDDASVFEVVMVLVGWRGQVKGQRRDAILSLVPVVARLGSEEIAGMTVAGVSAAIWLLAKYGTPADASDFLDKSRDVWMRSSWASRQAAAITPLLDEDHRRRVRRLVSQSGLSEALRVLASLGELSRTDALDRQLQKYLLHPPSPSYPYPLEKVIVARVLLRGSLQKPEKARLRSELGKIVDDPLYSAILRRR